MNGAEGSDRKIIFREEYFFAQAVLSRLQNRAVGAHLALTRTPFNCFIWNIFKLERHQVQVAGKTTDRFLVAEIGLSRVVGKLRSGTVMIGSEDVNAVSHAPRRDGKHAAELAAAHYPNG